MFRRPADLGRPLLDLAFAKNKSRSLERLSLYEVVLEGDTAAEGSRYSDQSRREQHQRARLGRLRDELQRTEIIAVRIEHEHFQRHPGIALELKADGVAAESRRIGLRVERSPASGESSDVE